MGKVEALNPGGSVKSRTALLNKGKKMKHHIQHGIGDGILPDILNIEIIDKIILVSDEDALNTACLAIKMNYLKTLVCGGFVGVR